VAEVGSNRTWVVGTPPVDPGAPVHSCRCSRYVCEQVSVYAHVYGCMCALGNSAVKQKQRNSETASNQNISTYVVDKGGVIANKVRSGIDAAQGPARLVCARDGPGGFQYGYCIARAGAFHKGDCRVDRATVGRCHRAIAVQGPIRPEPRRHDEIRIIVVVVVVVVFDWSRRHCHTRFCGHATGRKLVNVGQNPHVGQLQCTRIGRIGTIATFSPIDHATVHREADQLFANVGHILVGCKDVERFASTIEEGKVIRYRITVTYDAESHVVSLTGSRIGVVGACVRRR
jgi:hypothetical protein